MKRILVADSDRINLDFLKLRLMEEGYEVVTAAHESGLWKEAFREPSPDLVILELMINKRLTLDIYDLLLQFGFNKTVPVIFMTTLIEEHAFANNPSSRYVLFCKPFRFEDLLTEIWRLIGEASSGPGKRQLPAGP